MKTRLAISASDDPWLNMAVEEYLFDRVQSGEIILFLWRVRNTVMIGKHQNPLKECRCRQLELDGGRLGRRLSGGGAVFMDPGTLIFSFISDRSLYDLDRQLEVILRSVKRFGIEAGFSGRNDLTVQGRKFSGNAFYFKGGASLHHGTLLIGADLDRLARYLTVSPAKIASKGVDSVRSRVVNLSALNTDVTVEAASRSMQESFCNCYGGRAEQIDIPGLTVVPGTAAMQEGAGIPGRAGMNEGAVMPGSAGMNEGAGLPGRAEIEKLYQKHASWEWRYGKTPAFDIALDNRFAWGEMDIRLCVKDGLITDAVVYSDAMDCDLAGAVASALRHAPFRREAVTARIRNCAVDAGQQPFLEEIAGWLGPRLA